MKLLCVFLLVSFVGFSIEKSTPLDDHYVAAVFEYEDTDNAEYNLKQYPKLAKEAADQGADIVVFPELTLTNYSTTFSVPIYGALRDNPIPALNPELFDEYMVTISKAARDNEVYIVINGRELVDCTSRQSNGEYCPEAKLYIFNTNVVFDRTGKVIDRYRKINLFAEPSHNPAVRNELGVFTTDFGVTFGHFICFDMLFQEPSMQMAWKRNIKDIIYPTMWYSELPFLTAIQIQEAYAYTLDVNLLAAGGNYIDYGIAGSGIYSGKAGALVSIMPGSLTTKMLVAKVPKVPGRVTEPVQGPIYDTPTNLEKLPLLVDTSIPSHISRLLELGSQEFTLVTNDISCTFKVTLAQKEGDKHHRYRAAAFSGVRAYGDIATSGVRTCAVYACTDETRGSCGKRFFPYDANAIGIFEELSITATMPTPALNTTVNAEDFIVFPSSLTVAVVPLRAADFTYSKNEQDDVTVHTMTLTNSAAELYTFALWGRRFDVDGQEADPPLSDADGDLTPDLTTTPELEPESTPTEPTPAPGASAVHLVSKVLFTYILAFVCFG